MGQTLSEPVTQKETTICQNENLKVGASCMQGWRINMEDAHTQLLSLDNDKNSAFFAVYDGHGGHKVAEYAGFHLHEKILNQPSFKEGNISEAIRKGFLEIDIDMLNDESMREELAGTTAICVILKDKKIYCGNVGDSRAIASVRGSVQQLSFDHKPNNEGETRRIVAAGGWVEFNRVNGNLALSRALGDFVFKKNEKKRAEEQIVTALPDVEVRELTDDHEFIVIACDGIWDVLSNEEVLEFVRNRIAQKISPEIICEELMTRCLAPDCLMGGLGCDNMTVLIVCFLHGEPYEKLAERCRLNPLPLNSNNQNSNTTSTNNNNTNSGSSTNNNNNSPPNNNANNSGGSKMLNSSNLPYSLSSNNTSSNNNAVSSGI